MWNILCECINQIAQNPSVHHVMQQIQRHTVCTTTQCFENESDAFGVQMPTHAPYYGPYLVIAATAIAVLLVNMPTAHVTEKDH